MMAFPKLGFAQVSRTRLILRRLVHFLRILQNVLGMTSNRIIQVLRGTFPKLLENQHVRELLRFIFLGSVVELTRSASQKASDFFNNFFIVRATFERGDFAFDWVRRYLDDQGIWDQARIFHVGACSPVLRQRKSSGLGDKVESDKSCDDGHPHPVYRPTSLQPEFIWWRGYWITIYAEPSKSPDDYISMLTLSVWSRNRKILDDFVLEARTHYYNSPLPPRELHNVPDPCGSLLTARFNQGDSSYDWMIAFLRDQETTDDTMDLEVTTKQADLFNPADRPSERPLVGFKPAPRVRRRLRWKGYWVQFDTDPNATQSGGIHYGGRYPGGFGTGGSVTVTIHNSKREILEDLIAAARDIYLETTVAQVTVHLADGYGNWTKTVTKNRRSLNTLILPEGIKEELLRDTRDFLESEEWYVWAGVPHRRGYLLYGQPGTGKSSTIHALASELGLEMYYVQLSLDGMNDQNLATLVSSTPPRCILLLEDIDCAFLSREDDEDQPTDGWGGSAYSRVTLSGLLNILDSVTSEEGRIIFATTNHIDKLDPALIRAGRMDVKLEYKLANRYQTQETYLRFFERRFVSSEKETKQDAKGKGPAPPRPSLMGFNVEKDEEPLTQNEVYELARRFADAIPEEKFSLAQIQGYLLTKKVQPRGAVDGAAEWAKNQIEEKQKLEELKEEKKQKRREAQAAQQAAMRVAYEAEQAKIATMAAEEVEKRGKIDGGDMPNSSPVSSISSLPDA